MTLVPLLAVTAVLLAAPSNAVSAGLLASKLQRIENDETIDPVKRVVALLNEMTATLQKEMDEDQTLYNKLVCWCNTNEYDKDNAISGSTAKIAELESTIEGLTARSGGLTEKIAELEGEVKDNKAALAEATAIREKQLKEYNAAAIDSTQNLENLKAAIEVLSKHHPDAAFPQMPLSLISLKKSSDPEESSSGFLQAHSADKEGWAATEIATVKAAFKSASAFMQAHNSDTYQPTYKAQSGEIMGVLKQLLEEMQGDHAEAAAIEAQRVTVFNELRTAKESEISNGEAMAEQKEDELATTNNDLAEAKEDLEQETNALTEAQKFMKTLKETCKDAEKNFEERKKTRLEEIQAVAETISILTTDESRDNRTAVYSFVQIRALQQSKTSDLRKAAAAALRKGRSPELSMLASQVELDAFTKVKAAIDKMVVDLEQQQKDEVKKNDYCKTTIQQNEMTTAKKQNSKVDLEAKIGSLETKIKALQEGIANAQKQMTQSQVNMQRATEDRKAENMEYQKTVADQTAVIEVLHKALNRLAKFYDEQSLLQKKSVESSKRSTDDPSAPPVAQKEYEPNKSSGGVMSMIEKLIGEAKTMVSEAKKGENEAQGSYEAMIADTNSAVAGFMDQISTKTQEKADTHKEKLQTESDLKDTTTELDELAQYNAELHAECDEVLRNFDVRQEARQQEIEALKQAKQILNGASMS